MKPTDAMNRNPRWIFILCAIYGLHMVEEFTLGFVEWADRYFGHFDWTQNLIGNSAYLILLATACFFYARNPAKHLWLGLAGTLWVLSNAFIHLSATVLGGEYSPGLFTALVLYVPVGIWLVAFWARQKRINWKNLTLAFLTGGLLIMLLPTFIRSAAFHAQLARIFHLVR